MFIHRVDGGQEHGTRSAKPPGDAPAEEHADHPGGPMIRSPRVRLLVTAVAVAASSLAFTDASTPVVETAQYFISAGCPQDTPGTCTSTRWLGTEAGDATSNFITAITPVDEARYRADGSLNWRDYPSDDVEDATLSGDAIEAVVTLSATGPGIETTVHARMPARIGGAWITLTAEPQTVLLIPGERTPVTLTFDVTEHAGELLTDPTFEVAVHGVNLNAGHIDQEGGSTVTIPYVVPEPAAA